MCDSVYAHSVSSHGLAEKFTAFRWNVTEEFSARGALDALRACTDLFPARGKDAGWYGMQEVIGFFDGTATIASAQRFWSTCGQFFAEGQFEFFYGFVLLRGRRG